MRALRTVRKNQNEAKEASAAPAAGAGTEAAPPAGVQEQLNNAGGEAAAGPNAVTAAPAEQGPEGVVLKKQTSKEVRAKKSTRAWF